MTSLLFIKLQPLKTEKTILLSEMMKDFSWVPKSLCAFPIPGRDSRGGGKINIAQTNNTIMSVSLPGN